MGTPVQKAISLLQQLIGHPSFSCEEDKTADVIGAFLEEHGISYTRTGNNIWCRNTHYDDRKPTILLNSHHDTVRPVKNWTRDPFRAEVDGDILYGLGSNDAGGALVSLITAFIFFNKKRDLPFNLVLAASAEEEISGPGGLQSILDEIGPCHLAIVGEPTGMAMAIAERGLLVIDATTSGVAGHAARRDGVNAIYLAFEDIQRLQGFRFDKKSPILGEVQLTVTQIQAGTQHNVIPDGCTYVIDVRTNELYSNREVFETIRSVVQSRLEARSFRLNSSRIDPGHPLVNCARSLQIETFGSSTLSDQAILDFPSVKIGPGDSARSHTADEFIHLSEIRDGIETYIELIESYANLVRNNTHEAVV
jgi:acetylornithine deacetylase